MLSTFEELFGKQIENQKEILKRGYYDGIEKRVFSEKLKIPFDSPKLVSFHVQQLISEIGELLSADKRWKSFRNEKLDSENKLEEIADCFIVMMNIAMFSGYSAEDVLKAIERKINIVNNRIKS